MPQPCPWRISLFILLICILLTSHQVQSKKKGKDRTIILGGGGGGGGPHHSISHPPQILPIPVPYPIPIPMMQQHPIHSYPQPTQNVQPQIFFIPAFQPQYSHNTLDYGWGQTFHLDPWDLSKSGQLATNGQTSNLFGRKR